jgi:hypothetical protein
MNEQRPLHRPATPPRKALALLAFLSLSLGGPLAAEPPGMDDLASIGDEPFVFEPSVTAEMVFSSAASRVGWGSFDLTAAPEHDEIRVDLLVGKASPAASWHRCHAIEIFVDDQSIVTRSEYAGVPMASGVWDALTAKLTIAHVRDIRAADRVDVDVCGDRFTLPSAQRTHLSAFVRRFDDLALWVGPSAPTPKPELDDEHVFLPPEHDTTPSPA